MAQYVETPTRAFEAGGAIAQFLRVKDNGSSQLEAAGATDVELGTIEQEAFASGEMVPVRLRNATGTRKMVASEAISAYANVYGATGGKVSDTSNSNFVGIALGAASGDGSIIEVLVQSTEAGNAPLGSLDGNVVIDDDFIGDYPDNGTALDGHGPYSWTKTETNGLGVTGSDEANGVLKFAFDAVAEAATATLFMENSPVDVDQSPVFEALLAIEDEGDDAALDIDFGLAADDHATDFESTNNYAAFHLNGNSLAVLAHSDDGSTDTAETATGVTLTQSTFYKFKIDATDKSDIKFYIDQNDGNGYTRVASGTTFTLANYSGALTPILMVEKTSNDTTADVRLDRMRVQAQRN